MGPRGQEPNESTDDAVWQDLVARLEGTSTDSASTGAPDSQGAPPTPAVPPSDETAIRRSDAPSPHGAPDTGATGRTDRERAEAIFRNQPFLSGGPRDYSASDEPEDSEGFVPDEPPPLGTGDPLTVLAWIGAVGGPILLLLFAMFWRDAPLAATLGVLALFLAGAGYLVTKLPKYRDLGDDGAEV